MLLVNKIGGLINSWSGAQTFSAVTNKMSKTQSACGGLGIMENAIETVERARVIWERALKSTIPRRRRWHGSCPASTRDGHGRECAATVLLLARFIGGKSGRRLGETRRNA